MAGACNGSVNPVRSDLNVNCPTGALVIATPYTQIPNGQLTSPHKTVSVLSGDFLAQERSMFGPFQ